MGRRTVRLARSSAAANGGSTARIVLRMPSQARAVLRAGRRLRVVIGVTHSKSDTSVQRVVVLRG